MTAWPADAVRLSARPEAGSAGSICLGDPGADGPRLAFHDPALATGFLKVAGLVERPEALFRPGVVARVLRHSVRSR